jgi:4'-phosphopantetheinyl transferase
MPIANPNEQWRPADPRDVAGAGSADIDLWRVELDAAPADVARLRLLLGRDELERAARFHDERHATRFTVAHGLLRQVLAAYLDMAPERLAFGHGARGKPHLAHADAHGLQFNLSHAQHLGLIGVSRGAAIGVDIEAMRPMAEMADIARRNFAPAEFDEWLRLAPSLKPAGFFACWTRKEAVIKATGDGLSMPLQRFVVSVNPAPPARLLVMDGSVAAAAQWSLMSWRPTEGVFLAAAVLRTHAACRLYTLRGRS